jgi:autotransporter translocation and assembly factor TamB
MPTVVKGGRRRPRAVQVLSVLGIVVVSLLLLIQTPPVTRLVVRKLLPMINQQLNGRLAAEGVSGSLMSALTLRGVTLRDPEGQIVLQADRLKVTYSLWDLIKGKYVLGPLVLERPIVRLLKDHPGEQYSILRVFAKEDTATQKPASAIDLTIKDITLQDGAIIATVWRAPAEPQQEQAQQLDTVQLQSVNLSLPLIHYSASPTLTRAALLEIASARAFLTDPELQLAQLSGEARMQGDSLVILLRTIQLPASRLSAEAWLVTRPRDRRFDATAHIGALAAADIRGFISGADIPPEWRLSGDLRTTSLRTGTVLVQGRNLDLTVAGGRVTGQLTVQGQDNEWTAQNSRLEVAGVEVERLLRAFHVPSNLRAQIDGVITADRQTGTADLQLAGAAGYGVRGPVNGRLRASGNFDAMSLETRLGGSIGELRLSSEVAMGKHLAVRRLDADVRRFNLAAVSPRAPESNLNAHLEADVTFGSMPREGSLRLFLDSSIVRGVQIDTGVVVARIDNGLLTTDTLLVRAPGLQMTGDGAFGLSEDQTGDFTLTFDAPPLRAVGPVVRAFTRDSLADFDGALRIAVKATGTLSAWGLDAEAAGHELVFQGFEVDSLDAHATGTLDSLRYATRVVVDSGTALAASGGAVRRPDGPAVTLDSLTIERGDADWYLRSRAPLEFAAGKVTLDSVALEREPAPGRLLVSGAFPGAIVVRAEQVPVADLLMKGERDSRPDIDANVTYADGVATGTVALVTADRRPLNAEFASKPLHARLRADSLDLSIFGPLAPSLRELGGWLDGDVAVDGPTDAPRLTGSLQLSGGQATVPASGVAYHDATATLAFEGDALQVSQMSVEAGHGRADLQGRVRFARLDRPELDLTIHTERFQVMKRRDFLEVAATGELSLSGSPAGARMAGNARVNEGTAYLDKFMRSAGIDLSDTLYAQFVDTTVLLEATGGRSIIESLMDSLRIDSVSVDLGDDFWLKSPDASIQLAGRMTVRTVNNGRQTENADKYSLLGEVRAVRGIYRMAFAPGLTREFTIREGSIRYFGSPRKDAMLDLSAEHIVRTAAGDEVHVTAHIGGTLEKPVISLTSDQSPPLSETELISYLVFGAPTAQAFLGRESDNGEKSSVFTKSAEGLMGVLSGKLENAVVSQLGLPIDYFRIKPGEVQSGLAGTELVLGMQVRIFGYPSFLRASPRFCPREQLLSLDHIGINLETRLNRQWGIATSVDPVQGCEAVMAGTSAPRAYQLGVDLFWEKR